MQNYKVATCKHVYSKEQLRCGTIGIFRARWPRKTVRWPTSLIIQQGKHCSMNPHYPVSHLSWILYCMCRSFRTIGLRRAAYSTALSSGKPFEWNEMRQSHTGHSSTGFCRIVASSKTTTWSDSKRRNRSMISCIGRAFDFFSMAHTPMTT